MEKPELSPTGAYPNLPVASVGVDGASNAMTLPHLAMNLPEILTVIFRQCDDKSLAVSAQTCRQWSILALAELWWFIDNLLNLFKILGPIHVDDDTYAHDFTGSIARADWERFDVYARRIRGFRWCADAQNGFNATLSNQLFGKVQIHRPNHSPLLPNVKTIEWWASNDEATVQILPFVSPSVKNLTLTADSWCTEKGVGDFIMCLTERHLKLVRFGFDTRLDAKDISGALSQFFRGQQALQVVDLPPFHGTKEIVAALGGLESLQELGTWEIQRGSFREDHSSKHWEFLPGTFRALKRFEMDDSFQRAADVIGINTPPQLVHVRLQIYQPATNSELQYFLSVLAPSCPLLKKLELHLYTRADLVADQEPLRFESLEPLLECSELEFLEIVNNLPMVLSDENVETMASAWPRLSTLVITPDPSETPERLATSFTILRSFAQSFPPTLKNLGLFMEINTEELKQSSPPYKLLGVGDLNVGRSIPKGTLMHIVAFLCDICPPGVRLVADSEWAPRFVYPTGIQEEQWSEARKTWENISNKVKEIHDWEDGRRARGARSWYLDSSRDVAANSTSLSRDPGSPNTLPFSTSGVSPRDNATAERTSGIAAL
ncbi:hypothetical protein FRB93_006044 [Tulasnella sp. JGI-2019a]|nr:hypothetical protein FRB93_006044 [Tulasnella sp. JGI-2019a]